MSERSGMLDNPTWFIDQLTLYQNANSSPEAVKRNFLIRIAEFELIVADLRAKKPGDPVQHELILGRRGSGKSTLLRRIQIEIDEQKDLSEKYLAINLAEEQNAIYRLSDLWFEVVQELSIRLEQPLHLRSFDSFDTNQDFTRYLYAEVHRLLQGAGKRAVLLLDNLDRILENIGDDGHLLRETLLNYNDLQIIGGSTRMNEHFWDYDRPFYDFFRRHRLEGLTFAEIHRLLNHWSAEMNLPTLHDYALRHRGRVEAIRILTDGLPRALQFFIQVLLHDSELYGFDYLRKVMDKATPLYQERLNNLTPPHRKIVQEMAFWWEAAPTKVLVEKCRMESKLIASNLKQLDQYGIVETVPTGKKNHLYRLAERFFNTWLIVTQGNPDQKRRAKYLTLFLEGWYGEDELRDLAQRHLGDLKEGKLSFDKAMVLTKGLSQSRYIGVQERDALIVLTQALEPGAAYAGELPRTFKEIFTEAADLIRLGQFKRALEKLEEVENEEDGVKFIIEALCFDFLNQYEKAEKYYLIGLKKFGLNPPNLNQNHDYYRLTAAALSSLAFLYQRLGKDSEAEPYHLSAIELGSLTSKNNLARLYYEQGRHRIKALALLQQFNSQSDGKLGLRNLIVLEVWNNHFEGLPEKVAQIVQTQPDEDLTTFFTDLLHHKQVQLVLSLFESEQHGKALRERYELLYYAVQILAGHTDDNLLLRIPPEVLPTVQDIVKKVQEKQAFYRQPPTA